MTTDLTGQHSQFGFSGWQSVKETSMVKMAGDNCKRKDVKSREQTTEVGKEEGKGSG